MTRRCVPRFGSPGDKFVDLVEFLASTVDKVVDPVVFLGPDSETMKVILILTTRGKNGVQRQERVHW